ncbi:unnamed protein product [Rhizoctonia solani]|uniref:Peptidase M43 pregnancy-associated plasma-A domain-containing protein n=1 Tax=Rhizoctonia solani TaxID=456999 RepID=A0A8H2W7U5_9AGAM|nr:unnamed protein product [Rhizoctonia solani]
MVGLVRLLAALTLSASSLVFSIPYRNLTQSLAPTAGGLCGVDQLALSLPKADERLIASNAQTRALVDREIGVTWWVIYKDETPAGGYLESSDINRAITQLNSHYANTGFKFVVYTISYEKNANWFDYASVTRLGDDETQASKDMKEAIHAGTASYLNIYSVGMTNPESPGLLGYARFPEWYSTTPELDVVVFKGTTIPGGTQVNYDQGKVLTHEVGHWLGLYHTFAGGSCYGQGDKVADTRAESEPAYGCPVGRNSCPMYPGVDPIRNHMDYTYDACKTDPFTTGQITRMQASFTTYRDGK